MKPLKPAKLLNTLVLGILAFGCAPATPTGLVINRLTHAEGTTDCNSGPHPVTTTEVAMLHLSMTHPERDSFESSLAIDPASRSINVADVPSGEEWDLRLTGFLSQSAFNAGTYSWLGRRSGIDIQPDRGTGAGILLLRVEALQCTRTPRDQGTMLAVTTRLADGRVLVTGGVERFSTGDCEGCRWGIAGLSAALYNPVTGAFKATASMPNTRVGHTATLLSDGRVLVLGGTNRIRLGGRDAVSLGGSGLRSTALIFDPETERWSETPAPWGKRAFHSVNAVTPDTLVAAGGFAENDRIHADLVRFHVSENSLEVDEAPLTLACPRVGHQAFVYDGELILWGGSRCESEEQLAPEHWSPRAGLRGSRADRWGTEANLSFATSVELSTGTFMILGGATYRDGALQTPNRENSYYYLAASETHVRAAMLPEGTQGLLVSAARLSAGRRLLLAGGFADLGLDEPRQAYTLFDDASDAFSPPALLPGLSGALSVAPAGANQALMMGGVKSCPSCDGGLETLLGGAVFASAEDH